MAQSATPASARQREILNEYIRQLDLHIQDLKEGKAERAFEIKDLAQMLHVHPVHLSNTIKEVNRPVYLRFL